MNSYPAFQPWPVGPCPIEEVTKHDTVAVFGAGQGGLDARDVLQRCGVRVTAFLDNSPQKQGTKMDGVPVLSLESFMAQGQLPVVVGSAWAHDIVSQCLNVGLRQVYDMNWFCVLFMSEPDTWLSPLELLADEESRAVYSQVLYGMMNRWSGNRVATSPYPRHVHPAVTVNDGDIVICGGLYDGSPALNLIGRAECRVHAFEPMPEHRMVAAARLAPACEAGQVSICGEGLYSQSGDMPFRCIGFGAHVVPPDSLASKDENTRNFPVITVDDYVAKASLASVDLIQLEIEGAEIAALSGALETLERFKPKLQISIGKRFREYGHAVTYLHHLDLGYEIFVGHHTQVWSDTVLYARVKA